ncbi:hypothetical protein Clacol_009912 [Clathrus columnatus]|uniref:Cytochrome P450 n=1 Tax=Clathrus columnatus TaxID=1419009 RepID=A0AAV5AR51_9AGAM|nr:hypothetical protein Clacol_009912 [Clathrus columnatus]
MQSGTCDTIIPVRTMIIGDPSVLLPLETPGFIFVMEMKINAKAEDGELPQIIRTLVTSAIAYRLSPFHPLASFPGQTIARVSRIWSSVISRRGYQHIYYHELLLKYGPVIRIGPNHIITTEASAIPVVLGAGPFRKSDRYVTFVTPKEPGSLLAVVDPHEHAERRRLWEKGMNFKALQSYKEIIHSRLQQLVSLLSQQQQEVDINLSTFDIMGDLAFSGQFDALQGGSTELLDHLQGIRTALGIQDYLMLLTWLRYYIPFVPKRLMTEVSWFRQFSTNAMLRRMENGPKTQDFFYHLLNEEHDEGSVLPLRTLFREASLIIPAGYDTTANAGCHAFFYLLTNPIYLKRLQNEVDQHFSNVDEVYSKDDLQNLPYLNAVINETLRLAPGLASGSQRYLPKGNGTNGGIMLGNT